MSYTANPHRDAESYWDRQYEEAEHLEAEQLKAGNEIRECFQAFKPVPYVQTNGFGGSAKVRYMPFIEAMNDTIGDERIGAMLINVFKTSECPKVKALLSAMAEVHVQSWADEVGGAA
jgi:hypothetical protein